MSRVIGSRVLLPIPSVDMPDLPSGINCRANVLPSTPLARQIWSQSPKNIKYSLLCFMTKGGLKSSFGFSKAGVGFHGDPHGLPVFVRELGALPAIEEACLPRRGRISEHDHNCHVPSAACHTAKSTGCCSGLEYLPRSGSPATCQNSPSTCGASTVSLAAKSVIALASSSPPVIAHLCMG